MLYTKILDFIRYISNLFSILFILTIRLLSCSIFFFLNDPPPPEFSPFPQPAPFPFSPEPLRENWEILRRPPLLVVKLPMPAPLVFDGRRLPASYANFYIANRLVLVPTFNDPADRVALNTLAGLFPDREVVGISCTDLVLGLGTLHCMTMQQVAQVS